MSDTLRKNLPVIGAATRNIIIFITVLSIPLSAANTLGLSETQTSSWILSLYGLSGLLSLVLAFWYRQPLLLTGNLFVVIFISRLGTQLSFPELIGASILAGAVVLLVSLLGLNEKLAAWIPMPIIFGLLAGAVFSFVSNIFNQMGGAPILIGGTFLAYLLSRRFLERRIPAIFPALLVGLGIAAITGAFGQASAPLSLEFPEITPPIFSLDAILSATPVFVILITLQANMPSLRYLHGQDYRPPDRMVNVISGIGTMLGSLIGPTGISMSLPATSLVAGAEAGPREIRHRAVYLAAGVALLVGLLAGIAAILPSVLPLSLLLSLAGLAVVDVFSTALKRITQGPLLLGPLFTFVIAASNISLLGFGAFFWALVIGTAISLLLERDELRELRDKIDNSKS